MINPNQSNLDCDTFFRANQGGAPMEDVLLRVSNYYTNAPQAI